MGAGQGFPKIQGTGLMVINTDKTEIKINNFLNIMFLLYLSKLYTVR